MVNKVRNYMEKMGEIIKEIVGECRNHAVRG